MLLICDVLWFGVGVGLAMLLLLLLCVWLGAPKQGDEAHLGVSWVQCCVLCHAVQRCCCSVLDSVCDCGCVCINI